jgi:uridine phosphorylase
MPHHLGISQSKDSFYGEVEPQRMPVEKRLLERWKAWKMGGAICSEMEASAIFIISAIHRKRAGGIMLMAGDIDSPPQNEEEMKAFTALFDVGRVIRTAIEGLKVLIELDRNR